MYLIYLFSILLMIIAMVCAVRSDSDKFITFVFTVLFGSIISFFVMVLVSFIINGCIYENITKDLSKYEMVETSNLVAFRNSSGMTGLFFLGSGSINGNENYVYYIKLNDDSMTQKTISTKDVRIYENDHETPRVEIWRLKVCSNWSITPIENIYYKIFIPKGSLVRNFSLK